MSNLFTIPKAANQLGIPKADVIALINNGVLECISTGSKQFIKPQGIFNLIGTPAEITSQKDGYPTSEELSFVLPNGNDNADGEDMEEYKKYRGSITHDKAHNRFVVQIRDRATRKSVHNNGTFKDRLSAEQYLQRKLFEYNAQAYAAKHGLQPTEAQQTTTVHPSDATPTNLYPKVTLREYALAFLNRVTSDATSRTMEGYRIGLQILSKHVLDKYMYEITPEDIRREFTRITPIYKQSTIDRVRLILCLLFRNAAEGNVENSFLPIIPQNPTKGIGKPKSKVLNSDSAKGIEVFSDDDIKILFKTSRAYNFELYTMFTILECTGMRPGEMRALRWDAVNFDEKYISIYQAGTAEFEKFSSVNKTPKMKTVLGPTKNRKSRQVPLSDTAIEALKEWRGLLDSRKNIQKKESPYIFPNRDGFIKSASGCESIIKRYAKVHNLTDMGVNFYKFRHTVCTRLLRENYSFAIVMEILGDSTIDVIKKHYEHLNKEDGRNAVKEYYKERYGQEGIGR